MQEHSPHKSTEKRCAPRYATYKSSVVVRNNQEIYTTLVNVSASGLGFLCAIPLTIGEQVEIVCNIEQYCTLTHEEIDTTLTLPIEIARVAEEDGEFMIGAKVQQMTFEYRQMLKKLADVHSQFGTIKTHDPQYQPGQSL